MSANPSVCGVAAVLLLALLLCAGPASAVGEGVEIVVENNGYSQVQATVTRLGSSEGGNPLVELVNPPGSCTFSKAETAHDPTEMSPKGWTLDLSSVEGFCRYTILLDGGRCRPPDSGNCAAMEDKGHCTFVFTVEP